jgi:hypothetical protein
MADSIDWAKINDNSVNWNSVAKNAGSGAAAGTAFGPWGSLIGAGVGTIAGLAPSIFKFFSGANQRKVAAQINPYNPGYQMNNQAIDNARILRDRYYNYSLPGQTAAQNNINNTYQNAFVQGSQGATSGQDVADLAAKLAYSKNIAQNELQAQQQQGKDSALGQYVQANQLAGQEFRNKNQYELQKYYQDLARKDSLTAAGATNEYNALDTGASVLSSLFMPRASINQMGNTSNANLLPSIFKSNNTTNSSSPDFVSPTDVPVNYNQQYRYAS